MSRQIKAFITRDDFITPRNQDISPLHEISDLGNTYAKRKLSLYPDDQPKYGLHVFNISSSDIVEPLEINPIETKTIVRVVSEFSVFLTANPGAGKQQTLINYTNLYNTMFPTAQITELNYNNVISHNGIVAPDYLSFKVLGITCAIWLSDEMFQTFYPNYDIGIVFPFENFINIIQNTSDTLTALEGFDPVVFNARLEQDRGGYPATTTRLINIPYRVPNTTVERNCYFGFNVYGRHGNYNHILQLELYRILTEDLGLSGEFVESVFPSILKINEFFITPRWDKLAIPTQVGQIGINSQISLAYEQTFDTDKFIKIYDNVNYLKNNTYNVPFPYNNILLNVTNGFYSEDDVKNFTAIYSDFISVSSSNPDFGRMKTETQRLMTMLENMLDVGNANNQTELFNKIVANEDYLFTIIDRGGVTYVSLFFQGHQYYLVPKYQFLSLL